MDTMDLMILLGLGAGSVIIAILVSYIRSPFSFPYMDISIDVSGKRNPQCEDAIDRWINEGNMSDIRHHQKKLESWECAAEEKIAKSIFKRRRRAQYEKCLDEEHTYRFLLSRDQTRYRQVNYQRYSYTVANTVGSFSCSYEWLVDRDNQLRGINYFCTLSEYHSKNQRKLMTKKLRKQIMERDNYACRKCGKYMPDEVGLHIDHIVPVSRGGKTVPENLQVLCSKCNGSKSNKL